MPGDRAYLLFASDLNTDGSNNLLVNTYDELPWHVALRLPPDKTRPGARWPVELDLFEDARRALSAMHGFRPVAVRGVQVFRDVERVGDTDCARIEGTHQIFDIRRESHGRKEYGKQPVGSFTTQAWFRLEDGVPIRLANSFSGRVAHFKGIKQGEEAKTAKVTRALLLDLKPGILSIDAVDRRKTIAEAINRGAAWLKSQQQRNGSWIDASGSFAAEFTVGITALCLTALLHSGLKPDDPAIRSGFAYASRAGFRRVYDVSATIMAHETKYLPLERHEEAMEMTEEEARNAIASKISPEDRAAVQKATDWLLSHQTKQGTWGYPDRSENYDNSNTQYALLALKSASRCGVRIRSDVWKRIANYWIATQKTVPQDKVKLRIGWTDPAKKTVEVREEDEVIPGAWGYFTSRTGLDASDQADLGYGSMVCAGLTSLIIAESELILQKELSLDLRKEIDRAQASGLAWLQHNYTIRGCPPAAGFWNIFHYYYLYSLERVGVLYGIRRIDVHDWYGEGSLVLVKEQRPDGSWESYDEIPVVDTALALLFLKRATVPVVQHTQ